MARTWLVCAGVAAAWAWAGTPSFGDPMDTPAVPTARAAATPMTAVTHAGGRFVAVGVRGTVLLSDDLGRRWRQAVVPVSSDLVAVCFATPEQGWIAGHDGVVLHSGDGGQTWHKQLDGRGLEALLRAAVQGRAAAGDARAARLLADIGRDYERGTQQPLLGIWFSDARHGFAVGSFGILIATDDGGASWHSWMERIDNPELLHLFAVGDGGAGVPMMTSEKGTVFRLDAARQRFVATATGYAGSLFGFVAEPEGLVVYGLRGNALRSTDGGASWRRLETGVTTGLNGGSAGPGPMLLLASQGGRVLASRDHGQSFQALAGLRAAPFAAVDMAGDAVVVAGLNGVQAVARP